MTNPVQPSSLGDQFVNGVETVDSVQHVTTPAGNTRSSEYNVESILVQNLKNHEKTNLRMGQFKSKYIGEESKGVPVRKAVQEKRCGPTPPFIPSLDGRLKRDQSCFTHVPGFSGEDDDNNDVDDGTETYTPRRPPNCGIVCGHVTKNIHVTDPTPNKDGDTTKFVR